MRTIEKPKNENGQIDNNLIQKPNNAFHYNQRPILLINQ